MFKSWIDLSPIKKTPKVALTLRLPRCDTMSSSQEPLVMVGLWVQQLVQQGDLRLKKEPGTRTWVTHSPNLWTRNAWRTCWPWSVMCSEKGAQHWRRKRSDELEVEELYVTEENCKLFFMTIDIVFSSVVFSAARFWIKRSCAVVLWNANDE